MALKSIRPSVQHYKKTKLFRAWVLDPKGERSLAEMLWEYKLHQSDRGFCGDADSSKPLVFYMGGSHGFSFKDHHLLRDIPHIHLGPYVMRVATAAQCIVAITRGIFSNPSQVFQESEHQK